MVTPRAGGGRALDDRFKQDRDGTGHVVAVFTVPWRRRLCSKEIKISVGEKRVDIVIVRSSAVAIV